jgi:hypothetical protein
MIQRNNAAGAESKAEAEAEAEHETPGSGRVALIRGD